MKGQIGAWLIGVVLSCQAAAYGRDVPAPAASIRAQTSSRASIRMGLYLTKIVVHLRDGSVVYGFLDGLEPEALVIRKGANPVRVPSTEITRVVLDTGKNAGPFMLIGMLAGIYAGNAALLTSRNQPALFVGDADWSAWGYVLNDLIFGAAGVGLGYLASLFEKGEKVFWFAGDAAARAAAWQKLVDYLSGASRPGGEKVHLSFQSGFVDPSSTRTYSDALAKAGYYVGRYETPSRFNLLRGLRLTYSIKPRLEVGASVMFLGEPNVWGYNYFETSVDAAVRFDAKGYFVVAAFNPLAGAARRVQWKLGLGAGASRVRFMLTLTRHAYYYDYTPTTVGHSVVKTVLSPLVFSELHLRVWKGLSIGVGADYVLLPSESVPAFPDLGLAAQRVRLSNASVGVAFGWHF